jgi:putative FmdB family regulatory protein
MPLYEYECELCGIRFERMQHFKDEPLKECPECCGSVHRVIQPVGIIFKGSGFYITDNRQLSSTMREPAKQLEPPKGAEEKKALPAGETSKVEKKEAGKEVKKEAKGEAAGQRRRS